MKFLLQKLKQIVLNDNSSSNVNDSKKDISEIIEDDFNSKG